MKKTLSTHDVANELYKDEYANWSWYGSVALAEYLEELDCEFGIESELDVVNIRCSFSEYENAIMAASNYSYEVNEEESKEEQEKNAMAYLNDHTSVISFDGGVIIAQF
jgi:hypothetical protein